MDACPGENLAFAPNQVPTAPATALLALGLALWFVVASFLGIDVPLERWLAGSRTDHRPMRLVVPPAQLGRLPSALNFVWLAVLFCGAVVSSGYFWYSNQRIQTERQAVATLQTVANLKSSEISIWNADIASTVQALATAPFDPAALRATATSGPTRAEDGVLQWLEHLRATHGLEAVALFGTDGRELRRATAPDALPVELLRGRWPRE